MPHLSGRLTTLRPMTREDLPLLHRWLNDPDVMQYWDGRDHPASFDRVETRFRKSIEGIDREAHRYMIDLASPDAPAGDDAPPDSAAPPKQRTPIGLVQHGRIHPRAKNAQIDLLIGDPSCRDSGYGTDAMKTFLGYLFGTLHLHRAWLTMRVSNAQAVRGAEKCGFVREGVLRQHDWLEGSLVDVVVYGMLASEWRAGG